MKKFLICLLFCGASLQGVGFWQAFEKLAPSSFVGIQCREEDQSETKNPNIGEPCRALLNAFVSISRYVLEKQCQPDIPSEDDIKYPVVRLGINKGLSNAEIEEQVDSALAFRYQVRHNWARVLSMYNFLEPTQIASWTPAEKEKYHKTVCGLSSTYADASRFTRSIYSLKRDSSEGQVWEGQLRPVYLLQLVNTIEQEKEKKDCEQERQTKYFSIRSYYELKSPRSQCDELTS